MQIKYTFERLCFTVYVVLCLVWLTSVLCVLPSCEHGNIVHYRHILLYYFKKGKRAADTHKKICRVYGDDALTERVCQKWYAKFRSGDFDVNDAPRSGRPTKINSSNVKAIIEVNPSQSVREIATTLSISHTSVENHLRQLGYVSRLNVWVPHQLTEANLTARISICDSLRKRQENDPFLKRMVTGDEKWVVYDNAIRKRSIMGAQQRATTNDFEGGITSKEDDALRMVGFQGCHLLRTVTVRQND